MYKQVLRVIGVVLMMNITTPWTATWAAPRPSEPRLDLNTYQVPTLQWSADEQSGVATLPGGITLTVDKTLPLGWFTLSHPDWVGDLPCNMSVVVDDEDMMATYTIVIYDHDGRVVDIISGTISQDTGRPRDVRVDFVRHADGVLAEAVFQPSLGRATIIGEQALTPVSGDYGSDDGSRIAPAALAGIALLVVGIIIVVNWIFSDSYNCTTAWSRWWNNCQ